MSAATSSKPRLAPPAIRAEIPATAGRTYFRIEDAGSTDMEVHSYVNKYGCPGFEVVLGGDCELETVIRALKFITKVLEEESAEVYD